MVKSPSGSIRKQSTGKPTMRPASLTVRPRLRPLPAWKEFVAAGLPNAPGQMRPERDAKKIPWKKSCGSPGFIAGKRDNVPLDCHRQPERASHAIPR